MFSFSPVKRRAAPKFQENVQEFRLAGPAPNVQDVQVLRPSKCSGFTKA
jgi:hypothetical protein